MADNLSSLLAEFRASSARNSISPESLGFLLQAIRDETLALVTNISSGGTVDLSPVMNKVYELAESVDSLSSRLSETENTVSSNSTDLDEISSSLLELQRSVQSVYELIDNATVNVQAPALLPFSGFVDGVEINNASYSGGKWRPVYDSASKQFLAQVLPDNYIDGMIVLPSACSYYVGNVSLYNKNGRGRSDLTYIMGNNLYAFVGDELTKLTDNA